MRFAINLFIVNYLAKDQRNCNEELHFVRLTVILVKTVKKANKSHSDGSGWYLCGIFAVSLLVSLHVNYSELVYTNATALKKPQPKSDSPVEIKWETKMGMSKFTGLAT